MAKLESYLLGSRSARGAIESLCDAGDLDCEHFATSIEGHARSMRLLLYDRRPGGLGICEKLLEAGSRTLQAAVQVLQGCHCDATAEDRSSVVVEVEESEEISYGEGCPACLLDPRCSQYNENLAKSGAILLLQLLKTEMRIRSSTSNSNVVTIDGSTTIDTHSLQSVLSPREERRRELQRQARFQDRQNSRGLFISKPWSSEK